MRLPWLRIQPSPPQEPDAHDQPHPQCLAAWPEGLSVFRL